LVDMYYPEVVRRVLEMSNTSAGIAWKTRNPEPSWRIVPSTPRLGSRKEDSHYCSTLPLSDYNERSALKGKPFQVEQNVVTRYLNSVLR
jgi:hypothetical protein